MLRYPSTGIYPTNISMIQQQEQYELTSTSTLTNSALTNSSRNGAWNSATHCLHHFYKKLMISSKNLRTGSNSLRETCQRIPSSVWQFPLCASTNFPRNILGSLGIKQIHDSTRPNSSGDGQETSASPQRAQECHSTMVPSRLYRRTLARRIVQIRQRIFSSFADAIPHQHSKVGYVFLLNGAAISCRVSRDCRATPIVLNAAEAELYSLSNTT